MRKYKRTLEAAMTLLILLVSFYIGQFGARVVETGSGGAREKVRGRTREPMTEMPAADANMLRVVIDPGHGAIDSGKVGIDGVLEKDLNLAIAKKLRTLLEEEGLEVVMTREDDTGLYEEGESNKKQQDMKRRVAKIDAANAALAVSIHQNSYTQESVKGPQVFYYATSAKGQRLAQILQDSLNAGLQIERPREVKGNDTYYLLRKTSTPTVIVECGFLSNVAEARRLVTEEYQQQVAQAICGGVLEYLMENV